MYGNCKYCGNKRIVKGDPDMTQEELDYLATEECDCNKATLERKRENEAKVAEVNIENLFGESAPAAAELLKKSIYAIQHGSLKKVGIQIDAKVKAEIGLSAKDTVVVKRTYTNAEVLDTE